MGIISLFSFICLILHELQCKTPLLNLKIFKNWNFTFGTILLTILFGVAYGTITMLPQFLQNMLGYDSLLAGLAAGPMGIGTMSGVMFCAITSRTMDLRHQVLFGIIIFSMGCLMFSSLNLNIALHNVIIPNIVLGIGMTSIIIPGTTLLFSTVSKEDMTNASSIQNLIKNIGCAIGTSSVGFLVSSYAQVYQHYLVDKMSMLNEVFYEKIIQMQTNFIQIGLDPNTAFGAAQGKIYSLLIQQSTLCAFINAYKIYAIAIIILIPFVFILKKFNTDEK